MRNLTPDCWDRLVGLTLALTFVGVFVLFVLEAV